MIRLVSTGTKLKQVEGLLGTKDLSDWENNFVRSLLDRTAGGTRTDGLSDRQIERLEELWEKHFA